MSRRARLYIALVIAAGVALGGYAILTPSSLPGEWVTLGVLTAFATVSQLSKALFKSKSESDHTTTSYSPTLIFFFTGVLLLPSSLFALLVLIPHVVEWVEERYEKSVNLPAFYIQPFNIATHLLCGVIARQAYAALDPLTLIPQIPPQLIAGVVAALAYAVINHILIGLALMLARNVTLHESGVFTLENLFPDLIMLSLGYVVALLWEISPWLILPALLPLVLIQRALMVPQLKQEARMDSKTGLWNARHFAELFKAEFERAKRFERPLALIMTDLDLLRNINNTYGHLAGDTVLEGIGQVIRQTIREYDIAARFGGEEFVIAMPETRPEDAIVLAERVRKAVEAAEFHPRTTATPIRATLSLGVAYFPQDALTPTDLIHAADIAVYQAKLKGRNCVVSSSDLPHSIGLETMPVQDRLAPSETGSDTHAFASETDLRKPVGPNQTEEDPVSPAATEKPGLVETPVSSLPTGQQPVKRQSFWLVLGGLFNSRQSWFYVFLAAVIGAGVFLASTVVATPIRKDFTTIGLFMLLAFISELLQIRAGDENTVSVSVAVNFAAALVAGVPGLLFTSGAIALAHWMQQNWRIKMALYKTAFNWSMHMLAGLASLLLINLLGVSVQAADLPLLLLTGLLASILYFVVDTGLLALAISLSSSSSPLRVWNENFRWLTGHYIILCMMGLLMAVAYNNLGILGIVVFIMPPFMMRYAQSQYVARTRASMQELKRMNQELTQANDEVLHASRSIKQLNDELFLTLAKIIDARDPYVSGHAAQVSHYATTIAQELGLSPERIEHVRQAGLLHDIGKLGVPESILHKPERLTGVEYDLIQTHVVLGDEFLNTCQGLRHLAPFVRHHHEWWNGGGYPDHLQGEQIGLEARIISVCDAVEAMASDRPYHCAMSLDQIIAEIGRSAGTQFDPKVAETFVRIAERDGTSWVVNSARQVVSKKVHNGFTDQPLGKPQTLEFIVLPEGFKP